MKSRYFTAKILYQSVILSFEQFAMSHIWDKLHTHTHTHTRTHAHTHTHTHTHTRTHTLSLIVGWYNSP